MIPVIGLVVAGSSVLPPPVGAAVEVHVSPDGRDGGAGTAEEPVGSPAEALERIRAARESEEEGAVVIVRPGRHRLAEPLRIGPRDGNITWRAESPGRASLSGGLVVAGWSVSEDGTWSVPLPEPFAAGAVPRELFVNGERAVRARHPDAGILRVEQVGEDKRTWFRFAAGDLEAVAGAADVELVFLHDWSSSRIAVAGIDRDRRILRTRDPVGHSARHYAMDWFESSPRYWLEGSPAFVSAPGEWAVDRAGGRIVYRPRRDEDPGETEAIVPLIDRLVVVEGSAEDPVEGLRFEGIVFEHAANAIPAGGYAGMQAGFHEDRGGSGPGGGSRLANPAAFTIDHARDVEFLDCQWARLGGSGLWIRRNGHGVRVETCWFHDLSANGIMIGETSPPDDQVTTDTAVTGSLVERCGRQFFGSVGIWVGIAARTRIAGSTIRELPYTGISVGWRWNPEPSACRENVVEGNHIHHVMQLLSDGGGIYTLGRQPGTVLRGNVIHDVPLNAGRAESNGMFLDEGTTEIVIANNVVYGTERSPFRFHRAGVNDLRGNVAALPEGVPLVRFNSTPEENVRLEENRVVSSEEAERIGSERIDRTGRGEDRRGAPRSIPDRSAAR